MNKYTYYKEYKYIFILYVISIYSMFEIDINIEYNNIVMCNYIHVYIYYSYKIVRTFYIWYTFTTYIFMLLQSNPDKVLAG